MTYRRLYNELKEKALAAGKEESAIKIILMETAGFTFTDLVMNFDSPVPAGILDRIIKNSDDYIENNIPVQYIFGVAYFYGMRLMVNGAVLIPRPETEVLVEIAIERLRSFKNPRTIDIGCGSGAIALALKKHLPGSEITAVDISEAALSVAKANAKALDLDIDFILSDLFSAVVGEYDAIVSNPPYLAGEEEAEPIVRDNEPPGALYALDGGLHFYERIFREAPRHLKKPGLIVLEIPTDKGEKITALATEAGLYRRIGVEKDLSGRDRVMIIEYE